MQNKIKYYRLQKGFTLSILSDITGLSVGYLCHLENGSKSNPSFSAMSKISNALEKNITEIFLN